jgi:hypothetical protein
MSISLKVLLGFDWSSFCWCLVLIGEFEDTVEYLESFSALTFIILGRVRFTDGGEQRKDELLDVDGIWKSISELDVGFETISSCISLLKLSVDARS